MDLIATFGVLILALTITLVYYVRYLFNQNKIANSEVIYKNLHVHTVEGNFTGPMVYVMTILVLVIGPFSYEIISLTGIEYMVLNILAGFIFVFGYSPFAPITGFATLTLYKEKGKTVCLVGNVLARKYEVLNLTKDNGVTVRLKRGKRDFTIEASFKSGYQP